MGPHSKKGKWCALVDIGHAKCRLALISPSFDELRLFEVPTQGISRGKVSSHNEFTATLQNLVAKSGLDKLNNYAILNIPFTQTRTVVQSVTHRLGGVYRSNDYESILECASDSLFGGLDEVVDTFVPQFKIDGQSVDPFTFGLPGREISAQLLMATHPSVLLADFLTCVNSAGIEVAEFRSNGFGVARALQSLRSASENSVLVDFGHASITGAIMVGGLINQTFCIPAGSSHITKDLAAGLGLDLNTAEELKIKHGILESPHALAEGPGKLGRFSLPRVSELLSLSFKNFSMYHRSLDGGLLFCGAGSSLLGLPAYTSSKFNVKTPFVAQLTSAGARTFVGLAQAGELSASEQASQAVKIDSGWISLLAQARSTLIYRRALLEEKDSRPLSRLRPLWTWLSELSR